MSADTWCHLREVLRRHAGGFHHVRYNENIVPKKRNHTPWGHEPSMTPPHRSVPQSDLRFGHNPRKRHMEPIRVLKLVLSPPNDILYSRAHPLSEKVFGGKSNKTHIDGLGIRDDDLGEKRSQNHLINGAIFCCLVIITCHFSLDTT